MHRFVLFPSFLKYLTNADYTISSWTCPIQASNIPSTKSLFRCLGRTKLSVMFRGFLCKCFATWYVFSVRRCQHLAQPSSWKTILCRLSATAYSIYSQLPYILEVVTPSPCRGERDPLIAVNYYHINTFVESQPSRLLVSFLKLLPFILVAHERKALLQLDS